MVMENLEHLPKTLEEFQYIKGAAQGELVRLKEEKVPIVGAYCTFFPQELPIAAGAVSVSLCSTSGETIGEAEKILPTNLCPLIKSSFGFAITNKCPYFFYSDLVVGETTCDGKKKMFEYLKEYKDVHVMQLPNMISKEAMALWKAEIIKMKEKIEDKFGRKISDEDLRRAVKIMNEYRSSVKDFYEIMKSDELPLTGLELWQTLNGVNYYLYKEQVPAIVKNLKEDVLKNSKKITGKKRILITGCPIGAATEKIIEAVEQKDAIVVCYENCGGAKALDRNVEEDTDDIIQAMAEKYLNIGCACISPNDNRKELLGRMIKEYKVDGVVDMHLQTCTPFQSESHGIKTFVNSLGVPYVAVETDYSNNDVGQLNTRLEAFVEML